LPDLPGKAYARKRRTRSSQACGPFCGFELERVKATLGVTYDRFDI
jgi:hypothetical protein